ncbi:hypothetical protein [Mucilaginibacter sp. PAMB04168]|uniref:hypothetical protein n=1 Tax=Mucilaginibacter sp. PAMB04168 TaxID=3138567 RepID=UPI0031F6DC4A
MSNLYKNNSVQKLSGCTEENLYVVVKFTYDVETGEILNMQVIGFICLDNDPYLPGEGGTTPVSNIALHKALMKSNSCLDSTQTRKLETAVNSFYDQGCMNQLIYRYLTGNGIQFKICADSTSAGWTTNVSAAYNPFDKSINVRNSRLADFGTLEEEFFHAFQDYTYTGGTSQYAATANGNLEFEYRFCEDVITGNGSNTFTDPEIRQKYIAYIDALTQEGTILSQSELDLAVPGQQSYYYFVEK